MKIEQGLTFDDVLLIPKYSEIRHREDVDLSVDLGKGIKLNIPFISANMKNITEDKMAQTMMDIKGMALIHRFVSLERQIEIFKNSKISCKNYVGSSVGIKEEDKENIAKFIDIGCKIICVDVAHAHSKSAGEIVSFIAKKYPEILLIAGNVATGSGAQFLYDNGADVVKCGIGGGSLCTTRLETGCGAPQMSALENVYEASKDIEKRKFKIIADGGLRRAGDIVKALCFSDCVMLGNVIAGTEQCPGNIICIDGKQYKEYAGSSTHKTERVEGVSALIPYKGSVEPIFIKLIHGLQSGCSYQGVSNLADLKKDPQFVQITNAGLIESHPHDIQMVK